MSLAVRMGLLTTVVGLVLMGLALYPSGPAEAARSQTVGSVTFLAGGASRKAKGAKWTRLKEGTAIYEGDVIRTAEGSKLEAKLNDGSFLRLGAKSQLTLDNVSFNKGKTVKQFKAKLVVGKVWAAVRSLFGDGSSFEVTTDNAVAGVRGTRFSTAVSEGGDTQVKVYEGRVLVSNEPIYKVKGATKETRQEVPGPVVVSKKQWNELVAGAMQTIKVSASGEMSQAEAFALADGGEDAEWEKWNAERDKIAGME